MNDQDDERPRTATQYLGLSRDCYTVPVGIVKYSWFHVGVNGNQNACSRAGIAIFPSIRLCNPSGGSERAGWPA